MDTDGRTRSSGTNDNVPTFLTTAEVARLIRRSPQTVRRMLGRGDLEGKSAMGLVTRRSVEALLGVPLAVLRGEGGQAKDADAAGAPDAVPAVPDAAPGAPDTAPDDGGSTEG